MSELRVGRELAGGTGKRGGNAAALGLREGGGAGESSDAGVDAGLVRRSELHRAVERRVEDRVVAGDFVDPGGEPAPVVGTGDEKADLAVEAGIVAVGDATERLLVAAVHPALVL